MAITMTDNEAIKWSSFTTDDNLTMDDFIVFQDIDKAHSDMIDRYYVLKNKTYTTDAEKAEMTTLLTNLQEYMPTSETWNKLCACIRTMQMYMRDGVVVFYEQKQQEFENLLKQYKDRGDWNSTTTFVLGNLVKHNGYGFMSIYDGNNLNHEPNENISSDTYWTRFTIKGDKGDPSLNINYKGEYSSTTTYAIGDACSYNQIMYYAKQNGTIGILPTDNTKWTYIDKFVVSATQPTDTHMIWWDTTINKLKRYNGTDWVVPTNNASDISITDSANYFTSGNVEGALSEVMNKVNNIDLTASKVAVVDTANLYSGSTAETCLAEVMTKANSASSKADTAQSQANIATSKADTAQARADSAFTYANNGKTSVAGVVGNLSSSNTFAEITNEIQYDKNILAGNLGNKGISASSGDTLRNLAGLVNNITVQSMGGTNYASGAITLECSDTSNINWVNNNLTITLPNLSFTPKVYYVIAYPNNNTTQFYTYTAINMTERPGWRVFRGSHYNTATITSASITLPTIIVGTDTSGAVQSAWTYNGTSKTVCWYAYA